MECEERRHCCWMLQVRAEVPLTHSNVTGAPESRDGGVVKGYAVHCARRQRWRVCKWRRVRWWLGMTLYRDA